MSYLDDSIQLGDKTFSARMSLADSTIFSDEEPTSSTKAAPGQMLIVKLDDSYKLYLCVDIDDGSYIWKEISLS